jgi:hypothetical protein
MHRNARPHHTLRRLAVLVSAALLTISGLVMLTPNPALAAECSGESCDLVYPYLDYSYAYLAGIGWSNCANEGAWAVETEYGDNFSITLWYSNDCNANWGRIQFRVGSGLHDVGVHSASPAWNDNSHEVDSSTGDSSTYMVDGSYLAQACGDDAWGVRCTNWH